MSAIVWPPAARARVLELYGQPGTSGSSIAAVLAAEFGLHVSKSAVIGIANRGTPRPPRIRLNPEERLIRSRNRKRNARAAAREGKPAPAWAFPGANRPARSDRPSAAPKKPSVPRPRPVAAPKPVVAAPMAPAPPRVVAISPVPPSLMIPLTSAPIGACRFIADDPKVGPALVCGHPVATGSPWCPGHRKICVVPERTRAFTWIPRRAA